MPDRPAHHADRNLIERAARRLRDLAIADQYAGYSHPTRAFAFALVLDELALHIRDLDEATRSIAVDTALRITQGCDPSLHTAPSARDA